MTRATIRVCPALLCLLWVSVVVANDERWGNLQGRFVYDGVPPERETITITADTKVLGDSILDESLVVNACNRGLANVIIYLLPAKDSELAIHPSYAASADDKVELVFHAGRFEPRVLLLRTTHTMVHVNRDPISYNPRTNWFRNTPG